MKSIISIQSLSLTALVLSVLLTGCASRQEAPSHVSSHVSDAEFSRYVQKYPKMGESVRQGHLTKDAAYALRLMAPQRQVMDEFKSKVAARAVEINTMHISEAKKSQLIREYIDQNQVKYINAANTAGKQAEQEEKTLGHSPFAR